MRRIVDVSVLILLAGVAAFYYAAQRLPTAVRTRVKSSTLRLADGFAPGQNITYGQLFAKLEKNAADVDSDVIAAEAEVSRLNAERVEPAVRYMRAVSDVIRAEETVAQRQMSATGTRKMAEDAIAAAKQSRSLYVGEAMLNAARTDWERADTAQHELSEATANLRSALNRLHETREIAAKYVDADALCNDQAITRAAAAMGSN
jgi:hypothetical protein